MQQPMPQQPQAPTSESYYDEDDGSRAKWWILGGVAVLLVVCAIGYVASKRFHNDSETYIAMADTLTTDTIAEEPVEEDTIVHITPEFIKAISKYEELGEFSEGMAAVMRNGRWGFINVYGKEIIECNYDAATPFHEGKASVRKGELWGYIDKKNQVVIPIKIEAECASVFSDGLAYIGGVSLEGTSGIYYYFIDEHGKKVFGEKDNNIYGSAGMQYYACPKFKNGMVEIYNNDKYTTFDKQGRKIKETSSSTEGLWEGDYEIYKDLRNGIVYYGLKNTAGKVVISAKYGSINGFCAGKVEAPNGVVVVGLYSGDVDEYWYNLGVGGIYGVEGECKYYGYADFQGNDTFSEDLKERCANAGKRAVEKILNEQNEEALHGAWLLETSDGNIVMVFRDDGKTRTYMPGVPCLTSSYSLDDGVVTINDGKGHMYFRDATLSGADGREWTKISSDTDYVP